MFRLSRSLLCAVVSAGLILRVVDLGDNERPTPFTVPNIKEGYII